MDATPLISIVVPVYNAGSYLRSCMDSLIGQTLYDIEIICVLDCPTDGSDSVIEEYAAKDNRIVVIRNEEQLHVGESRNVGMRAARGQYIGFSDHDDFHSLDMYENLWALTDHGQKNVVFSSATYIENNKKVTIKPCCCGSNNPTIETCAYSLYGLYNTLVTTNLYRKVFLENNHIVFEDTRKIRAEDMLFNLSVLLNCTMQSIAWVNKSFYHHIMTESNFGQTYEYNRLTKQIVLTKKTLEYLDKYQACHELHNRFKYLLSLRLYSGFLIEMKREGVINTLKIMKIITDDPICSNVLKEAVIEPTPKASVPKRFFLLFSKCLIRFNSKHKLQ